MKTIRAKFTCQSVNTVPRYKADDDEEDYPFTETVKMSAVVGMGGDNTDWAKYTPSGTIEKTIDNPAAQGFFKPGADYYVDFVEVKKEPAEAG